MPMFSQKELNDAYAAGYSAGHTEGKMHGYDKGYDAAMKEFNDDEFSSGFYQCLDTIRDMIIPSYPKNSWLSPETTEYLERLDRDIESLQPNV